MYNLVASSLQVKKLQPTESPSPSLLNCIGPVPSQCLVLSILGYGRQHNAHSKVTKYNSGE